MLLEFDDSLINYFKKKPLDLIEKSAIDNIFQSHDKKIHYVSGSRKLFDFFRSYSLLSEEVKSKSNAFYLYYINLKRKTLSKKTKIVVMPSDHQLSRTDTEEYGKDNEYLVDYTVFYVPLKLFADSFILERTCLISENSSDVDFYFQLSKGIDNLHKKNSEVIFSRNAGGGGTTFKVIKDKVKDKNMSLIVVDSDQMHPLDEYGKTYKLAKRTYDLHKNNWLIGFNVLSVHEKENLIPPSIYMHLEELSTEIIGPWLKLYNHSEISHLYNFADLKKGISALNFHEYYSPLLESTNGIIANCEESRWGYSKEFVGTQQDFEVLLEEVKNDKTKNLFLLPPLGNNILDNFTLEEHYNDLLSELESINNKEVLSELNKKYKESVSSKIDAIETFPAALNDFHKFYLVELSNRINDWGFCNIKSISV